MDGCELEVLWTCGDLSVSHRPFPPSTNYRKGKRRKRRKPLERSGSALRRRRRVKLAERKRARRARRAKRAKRARSVCLSLSFLALLSGWVCQSVCLAPTFCPSSYIHVRNLISAFVSMLLMTHCSSFVLFKTSTLYSSISMGLGRHPHRLLTWLHNTYALHGWCCKPDMELHISG